MYSASPFWVFSVTLGDLRMILNQLQMLALSPMYKQVGVKYMDMKDKLDEMSKDQELMLTPFDACRKLLTTSDGARLSFKDRMDMFFIDHSLAPLLVQENYLKSVEKKPVDAGLLARCAFSADLMTLGDIMSDRIRGEQEWNLLPHMGVVSSVYPAMATNGFVGFPSFPQFLGKYSTMSRTRRLNAELQTHLRLSATVSSQSLPMSGYTDLLFKKCIRPMLQGKPDAVLETIKVLDAYGLRREHLTEHLTELRLEGFGYLVQTPLVPRELFDHNWFWTNVFCIGRGLVSCRHGAWGFWDAHARQVPHGFEGGTATQSWYPVLSTCARV